jgi:hypothetical protein
MFSRAMGFATHLRQGTPCRHPRALAPVPVSLSPGVGQEHFSYFPGSYHAIIVTISPNNRLDTALTGAQLTLAQATAWSRRTRGQNSGMIHPGRSRSPWGTPPHASTSQPSKARWSSPRRQEGAEFIGAHGRQRRDDRRLRPLFRQPVGGAAERPAAPAKANNDRSDGTDGRALQQTLQRFSLKD